MKQLKKALISSAVLAGLAAGNAFAGTEACFEIYKGAVNNNFNVSAPYGAADCYNGTTRNNGLTGLQEGKVAYELTRGAGTAGFTIDLGDNDFASGTDKGIQLVYIPTTDIPGASRITIKVDGATFGNNANQIFLLGDATGTVTDATQASALAAFKAAYGAAGSNGFPAGNFIFNGTGTALLPILATSDGLVNGQSEITFLTQSGTTIPAGTRMLFSRSNSVTKQAAGITLTTAASLTGAEVDALTVASPGISFQSPVRDFTGHLPVVLNTKNETCTENDSTKKITIQATAAKTDGGSNILGGQSRAETLIDVSPQFRTFIGSAVNGQVNAQTTNSANATIVARSEFVFEANSLTLQKQDIVTKFGFLNRASELDKRIVVDNDDKLRVKFQTEGAPGESVRVGIFNGRSSTGALSGQINLTSSPAQTGVYANYGVLGSAGTVQSYALGGLDVFTPNVGTTGAAETAPTGLTGAYNDLFFSVSQRDLTKVLGFNYAVDINHTLDLADTAELDHCNATVRSHNIGINGAVLKVPYTVSGQGNFVRITNEHNQEAEVTVDVFGESVDGNVGNRHVTAVRLANIPAKSSYVYFVPEIIDAAVAQKNYTGADGAANTANSGNPLRHSLTFAVTAPKNTVHGVTVQRLSTGNDRVMPVLDQNEWNQ